MNTTNGNNSRPNFFKLVNQINTLNMKKVLFIALFSIAIMANATEKKGIITNPTNEKEIVTNDSENIIVNSSKEIKTESNKCTKETSEDDMFFGCGSEGNGWYTEYRNQGYSHRDARELRRIFVRECRGNGPGGWLNLPVRF